MSPQNPPVVVLTAEERLTGTVRCPQCSHVVPLMVILNSRTDLMEISAHTTASARGQDPKDARATWCFGSYTVVYITKETL
jgi:hypothetical protein